jgi:hypothetical protein
MIIVQVNNTHRWKSKPEYPKFCSGEGGVFSLNN